MHIIVCILFLVWTQCVTKGIFDNVCDLISVVCAFYVFPVHTHTHTIKAICSSGVAVGIGRRLASVGSVIIMETV